MTDVFGATPTSSTGNGNCSSKTSAVKDKECPYCHQVFTSSSLGRHLDLFIKERHAKPADNIHNVDEIRRMRGTITRRQARNSAGKRHGSGTSSSKTTPIRDQRSPSIQREIPIQGHPDDEPVKTYLNKASWQSTGVINNLPQVPKGDTENHLNGPTLGPRSSIKQDLVRKHEIREIIDQGRAAELALKEVLESVKAAKYALVQRLQVDLHAYALSYL